MKKKACIIVDDEPLARELLQGYVQQLAGWDVKATCRSVADAYEALYQHQIDVIFLDINMPNVSGIEFLRTLRNPPLVVFTTAYAEYAAQAFDLKAVDYLVKPITEERFREAVAKVERLLTGNDARSPVQPADHVFLKQDSRLVKVPFDAILYVEALKDFSKVHKQDKPMLVSMHLKLLEDLLPADRFLRIHRSYIVALLAITALQGNVVEIGKQEIPIGATYKEGLLKRLGVG